MKWEKTISSRLGITTIIHIRYGCYRPSCTLAGCAEAPTATDGQHPAFLNCGGSRAQIFHEIHLALPSASTLLIPIPNQGPLTIDEPRDPQLECKRSEVESGARGQCSQLLQAFGERAWG